MNLEIDNFEKKIIDEAIALLKQKKLKELTSGGSFIFYPSYDSVVLFEAKLKDLK